MLYNFYGHKNNLDVQVENLSVRVHIREFLFQVQLCLKRCRIFARAKWARSSRRNATVRSWSVTFATSRERESGWEGSPPNLVISSLKWPDFTKRSNSIIKLSLDYSKINKEHCLESGKFLRETSHCALNPKFRGVKKPVRSKVEDFNQKLKAWNIKSVIADECERRRKKLRKKLSAASVW